MRKVLLLASSPIVILLVALLVSTRSDVSSASPTAGSLCGPYGVALDGAGNLVEPYHWR